MNNIKTCSCKKLSLIVKIISNTKKSYQKKNIYELIKQEFVIFEK